MSLDLEQAKLDYLSDLESDALMADWARRYGVDLILRVRELEAAIAEARRHFRWARRQLDGLRSK